MEERSAVEDRSKSWAARVTRRRVLCIDDEPMVGQMIEATLEAKAAAIDVTLTHSGAEGLAALKTELPDAVLLDLGLPDMNGLGVLERIKATWPELPVIMLTGQADVRTAVQAIQMGAYQFLTKPFNSDELIVILGRAMERSLLLAEIEALRRRTTGPGALAQLLGSAQRSQQLVRQIRQVAPSMFTVLIQGETGVGKEVVARALHEESPRADKPFVAIDCGALPETLLESELFGHEKGAFSGADRRKEGLLFMAEGGTLFLDEIGNMPMGLQAKLLRVLQERKVMPVGATTPRPLDARFIAATNVTLENAVKEGRFRQDLYYRLAEFVVHVSPLRERAEDVAYLARKFMEEASVELRRPVRGFDDEAMLLLSGHAWPGNVRELRNLVRQAVLLAEDFMIRGDQLRGVLGRGTPVPETIATAGLPTPTLKEVAERATMEAERTAIVEALKRTGGNKSQAARLLQVDFKTLHLKIKRMGLGINLD